MARARTREEIEEIINNLGYDLLDEYKVKNSNRRVIIQDKFGYKYDVILENIIHRSGNIRFVDESNPFVIRNIQRWLVLENKDFQLSEDTLYFGNKKKLKFFHTVCQEYFYMNWDNLYQGQSCAVCSGQQAGQYNNLAYLYPDLILEWNYEKNTCKPENVVCGSNKKVAWKCISCKYEWNSLVYNRTYKKQGCPKCQSSHGENKILTFLSNNNIEYIREAIFDNCKYKRGLPFDFYLPNYNLCVEYHGEQHYFPVDFGGKGIGWAKTQLKENKIRDKIKENYCYENNINLLIIPYWKYDSIGSILSTTLL